MPKAIQFDDFFKYANFFYNTVGIQAYEQRPSSKLKKALLYLVFFVSFANMNFVLCNETSYVFLALRRGQNIMDAIFTLACMGFVIVGSSKIICIRLQRSALNEFVKNIHGIFPQSMDSQHDYNMPQYLRNCMRINIIFTTLYMVSIWIFNLLSIVEYWFSAKILHDPNAEQMLPYYMYIPYEWHHHWSYGILYILEIWAGYTSASGHISSDFMLSAFATQLCMHYDYVARKVLNYKVQVQDQKQSHFNRKKAEQIDLAFLKNIINYHSKLLDLSSRMNEIFAYTLFLNFGSSTFVICFVGFHMSVGAPAIRLFKLVLFMTVMLAQAVVICHYGQLLIDSSINVADAVYNHNWSTADIRYKKVLIVMIKRAQKSAQVKATTFIPISRGTITELMQISYKFFALLRTMYVQK